MVLSIELEDNVWAFDPGDTINGKVVILKEIWNKVEGLTVRLYGKLEVGLPSLAVTRPPVDTASLPTSSQGHGISAVSESPSRRLGCVAAARKLVQGKGQCEEILLDHTISLLDNWKVLKPGRNSFDFTFTLPNEGQLPPSLKINGARIQYEFVTTLKRPRDDYKLYQTPFYIKSSAEEFSTDDNNFDHYFNPAQFKAEQRLAQYLGCCMSAKISVEAQLERTIFPVGGTITFVVNVRNDLRSNLEAVIVKLVRKFKANKTSGSKTKEVVVQATGPTIGPGESQLWNGSLQIPNNLPVSNVLFREIFEMQYVLQFMVRPIKHPSKIVTLKFPLMLVPQLAFTTLLTRPSAPPSTQIIVGETLLPQSLPPPTYYEATNVSYSTTTADQQSTESTSQLMPIEIS